MKDLFFAERIRFKLEEEKLEAKDSKLDHDERKFLVKLIEKDKKQPRNIIVAFFSGMVVLVPGVVLGEWLGEAGAELGSYFSLFVLVAIAILCGRAEKNEKMGYLAILGIACACYILLVWLIDYQGWKVF